MVCLNFDPACYANMTLAVSNAVITVLIYMLLLNMMGAESGKPLSQQTPLLKSMEFMLVLSAFIAFNLNQAIFAPSHENK